MNVTLEDLLDRMHGETSCVPCKRRLKSDRLDRDPPVVRVGPALRLEQGSDRWGRPVPCWYAPSYGLMTERRWAAVQDFQTPVSNEVVGASLAQDLTTMEQALASPAGIEANRKFELNPTGSAVWEMNLHHPRARGEWIRYCAVFGDERLVRWSRFDAYVRRPLLALAAGVLTLLRYGG